MVCWECVVYGVLIWCFQDGMSALDLANQYSHEDVRQVLHHFRSLLSAAPDQTLTPKFTYFRKLPFLFLFYTSVKE